jgi:hypothetical protein
VSLAMSIRITKDTATASTARLGDALKNPTQFHAGLATELKLQVQTHLLRLPKNKRNWPTTNFWPRAAKATSSSYTANSSTVTINQIGVRQRYYGGLIRPVSKKMLTIPISPEAYGKTASDFPGAFLLKTKKGAYIVQRGEEISAAGNIVKRRGRASQGLGSKRVVAALEFLFKLSPGVYQEPNAAVLPTEAALTDTALKELNRHITAAIA